MSRDAFDKLLNRGRTDHDLSAQFREERLANRDFRKSQWPAVIDNAALDLIHGIALGHTQSRRDIGATIDAMSFPHATGNFYHDGLRALAGNREGIGSSIQQYDGETLAKFAYRIIEFREKLREQQPSLDIDRGIEALVEKLSTDALPSGDSITDLGLGTRLEHRSSAADMILQLFADPEVEEFGQGLFRLVNDEVDTDSLITELDRPQMTTVLWEHQREALREWVETGRTGYVDMATATGKTVLGLGAIALLYGSLHPHDQELVLRETDPDTVRSSSEDPRVLIVAGNELLLQQWHRQFDEHLDIPPERTEPEQFGSAYEVTLNWGRGTARVEFQTAQALASRDVIGGYDLVILDEAHSYRRGSRGASGWRDVFNDLAERSNAILAMSGSIQTGWQGDTAAKDALEQHLHLCHRYGMDEAREDGIIADFDWEIRYSPTPTDDAEDISTHTRVLDKYLDLESGKLLTEQLGIELDGHPNEFPSHNALRSFVQTEAGSRLRNRSDRFDILATTLLTRRTTQWNQSVTFDSICGVLSRHLETKCVVLVQSYEEATALEEYLESELPDAGEILALHGREDDSEKKILRFNDIERGFLVGPGKLLGTGVDLPDAEVAVNVAQGNVTTSLVQRIGRVLRNPSGSKHATFYHLVPQPTQPEAIIAREDGHRLLLQAAEFHSLGRSIEKPPQFSASTSELEGTIRELETAGAEQIRAFPRVAENASGQDIDEIIEELLDAVERTPAGHSTPAIVRMSADGRAESPESTTTPREDEVSGELTEDDQMELDWLQRVALNNTSHPQALGIRLSAVNRLAEFGQPAEERLWRIADEDVCDESRVREVAEDRLAELGQE